MMQRFSRTEVLAVLVIMVLAGLPLAVWLDLQYITESALRHQAGDLNSVISGIRGFYASDVVGRVLTANGAKTTVRHDYELHPGAIPIPATFSLELGRVVREQQGNIAYKFESDYPFKGRAPHQMDGFEVAALQSLRAQPNQPPITDVSVNGLVTTVRYVSPVIMGATCVACHNTHPLSPKRDWKVGDVRGIQELEISQPIVTNFFSFRFLLLYLIVAGVLGFSFILLQRRQNAAIAHINSELERNNEFLASISAKISKYLSPQIYNSIFSGQTETTIHTTRKKLTIFFSDIKDFTATSERLQPEELAALLNEYLTEMSTIALRHGGTIDKFVGDAILVFFGDPESRGVPEDARAAVLMAIEMQGRLRELNEAWQRRGVEKPFAVRMGLNTGFCNVGNFGSHDRMDYTIIGAEANLAARLQSIAEPGHIVLSYETYALVRDVVRARALPGIHVKGISREVIPYAVDGLVGDAPAATVEHHADGLDLRLDANAMDAESKERARSALREALDALH
ncbi:MAG: adenylate/guanylate cyclase domain-containing protein [Candidatus Eremiobacteraeota bacterium]|nr:adenylate/guanylate cyclase domain-containing protein [Candidatus Eremiobacteraeota bacterium]